MLISKQFTRSFLRRKSAVLCVRINNPSYCKQIQAHFVKPVDVHFKTYRVIFSSCRTYIMILWISVLGWRPYAISKKSKKLVFVFYAGNYVSSRKIAMNKKHKSKLRYIWYCSMLIEWRLCLQWVWLWKLNSYRGNVIEKLESSAICSYFSRYLLCSDFRSSQCSNRHWCFFSKGFPETKGAKTLYGKTAGSLP